MDFTPGTEATIQATTLENQCYSIARSIQNFERSATYNPGNEINLITSSSDDDTQVFSGNCTLYCNHRLSSGATSIFEYLDPYTSLPIWSEGTGGDGVSDNWVEALAERFLMLANLERNSTYNLGNVESKITNILWSYLDEPIAIPVVYNATLSFEFSLDYTILNSSNGTTTEATSYLTGTYPGVS
ncbi:MAG: hypothetical protein QNJ68_03525 [Microcoleaceae cyanobacterium MO_207.B10]|nr:hypothetical protein [Microcoleaceae cyanobacterium MO_207.B10]